MFVSSTGILPVICGAFSLFGWGSGHKFGWYCSCNLCSASRLFVGAFLGVNDHFGCLVLRRQPLTRDRVGHNAKTGSPMSKTQERNLKKRVKSEKSFRQILARWPQRSSPPPGGTSAYALPPHSACVTCCKPLAVVRPFTLFDRIVPTPSTSSLLKPGLQEVQSSTFFLFLFIDFG